ncbi:MAG: PASTA domain-containing protein [Coriobacteriia bacterium]|nr:PASTA domain-containing protein [Coriobacteriia bacterium]
MAAAEGETGHRRETDRRRRALLGSLVLLGSVAVVAWWALSQSALVPDVAGLTRPQAAERLQASGFNMGATTVTDASEGEDPGTVIAQEPPAGTRLFRSSRIDVTVAREFAEAPGRRSGSAGALLSSGYLDAPKEGREVDDVRSAPDSPPAGSGPQVPLVLRMSASEARRVLAAGGYGISVARRPSSTSVPAGRILRQDPPPGAFEPRGTVVEVWVSTGPPRRGGSQG